MAVIGKQSVTYTDGLVISVSEVVPYAALDLSPGQAAFVVFVDIQNGTPQLYDPLLTRVTATVDGVNAMPLLEPRFGNGFQTSIPPAGDSEVLYAFTRPVESTTSVVIQVDPRLDGMGRGPAVFSGQITPHTGA